MSRNIDVDKSTNSCKILFMNKRYENLDTDISRIEKSLQKIKEKEMRSFNLKGSSVRILMILNQSVGGMTASTLSKTSGFDKAHISRVLKELCKQDLISHSTQKYASKISLTDKGKEICSSINQKIDFYVQKAGYNLDDSERQIFYKVLSMIANNLEEINQKEITAQ